MERVAALDVIFTPPERSAIARSACPVGQRFVRRRPVPPPADATPPAPEAPAAAPPGLVVVGLPGTDPGWAVRALLDLAEPVPPGPEGGFLVLRYGRRGEVQAYIPGYRQRPADSRPPAAPPAAPTRPPRRVEASLPAPLLRELTVVVAPPAHDIGPAYARVVIDVAERAGGLLLLAPVQSPLGQPELDLAAQVAGCGVAVFVATVHAPDTEDWSGVVAAAEAAARQQAPALAAAGWHAFDGTADSVAGLRGSVLAWAGPERSRRAAAADRRAAPRGAAARQGAAREAGQPGAGRRDAAGQPAGGAAEGPIRVAVDGPDSGWEELLDREIRWRCHSVWQRLAIELAHIHLRGVHELVFGGGCPGLPALLDLELQALSGDATRQLDDAVAAVVDRVLPQVLAAAPGAAELPLIGNALRRTLEHDGHEVPEQDRVLLVTSTAGLAVAAGTGADVTLPAYRSEPSGVLEGVLPPIGIALTGGCYVWWRDPSHADVDAGRGWLQRVVREVENGLHRELELRFDALHRAIRTLLSEAVDHGIVLI